MHVGLLEGAKRRHPALCDELSERRGDEQAVARRADLERDALIGQALQRAVALDRAHAVPNGLRLELQAAVHGRVTLKLARVNREVGQVFAQLEQQRAQGTRAAAAATGPGAP